MPVVELSYSKLQKIVGGNITKEKIAQSLPYLGLDIEGEEGDVVKVEYSPNRPDYSTDVGISLGLQGLLGIKTGKIDLDVKKPSLTKYRIKVDNSVSSIRPFVTGIIARRKQRGRQIDDHLLKQLIVMQEDLHSGIGRQRKKSSIGIHDLSHVSFPLLYTTVTRTHRFTPLHSINEVSISDILQDTEVGRNFGHLLGSKKNVPIIIDNKGNTVSFPPIINASATAVTNQTKDVFVEVTGMTKDDVEDVLSIVAITLQEAGFSLESISISGGKNSTPKFRDRKLSFNMGLVKNSLGIELPSSKILHSLRKARIGVNKKGKDKIECTVPRYRFDIFGPMDLVEEVALGYGIQNLTPSLSPSVPIGEKNTVSSRIETLVITLIGLGCMEAINSGLSSKRILYDLTQRAAHDSGISVSNSKSQEHTILRDMIIPGLLDNLSKNIHESYPQRLFEIGTVFFSSDSVKEEIHLACVLAHKDANFTEAKSLLQSSLKDSFGLDCITKSSSHSIFQQGKTASVVCGGKEVGVVGQVSPQVAENFRLRVPVAGFELKLSGLIFD